MSDICYLCGLPITATQARSNDHVIPATLITRAQPKVKGFDYAGHLPTHEACNNRFGDETYVAKALDLLPVLYSSDTSGVLQNSVHAGISILPIDASRLPNFKPRDLRFFKLIDARQADVASLSDPKFYSTHTRSNPARDALRVALSVLAKSAAALLVKRHLDSVPSFWRIYAQAYTGNLTALNFSELLGIQRPFDDKLKVWVVELPSSNWHVIYAARDTLIFFTFVFADRNRALRELIAAHSDAETLKFLGTSINEILISGWHKV